jgi:hypothetical protein
MTALAADDNIAAMVRIYYVPRASIDDHWPAILELLAPAIEREARNIGPEHVYDDIAAGNSLAWVVEVEDKLVGSFVTSLVQHPRRRTLRIDYLAGSELSEWWAEALSAVEISAKQCEAQAIEANGRDGWTQYARRVGFERRWSHFELEI